MFRPTLLSRAVLGLTLSLTSLAPTLASAESAESAKEVKTAKLGPGATAVKQANDTIASLLKQQVTAGSKEEKELSAKVTTSVRGFLDIDELGKRAMVDQWSKLSKAQQEQFLAVLRELIEANYVKGLRANVNFDTEYAGETADKEGNVVVATKVKAQRKGKPFVIAVDYVLVKQGDKLRAWDVKTDGVGLVENYRTMFNKIIEREKFEGLIKRMQDKKTKTAS
ncbi:MAG: ABC transporter substrate-binding protein [Deltaproteobacteria bacterium]|nr:ABC transporter substrate-binding protein [Deltaproteobacteria bacterium]